MRKPILTLAALSIAVLPAIGCGKNEAASSAASLAPATSLIYGEVTLQPEGDQKEAVDTIVSKFPGQGSAGERIQGLIEKALKEGDAPISYRDDIEPWLGDEAAFFVTGTNMSDGAALIAADDEDKARSALEKAFEGKISKRSYKDVEYIFDSEDESAGAVFDGFLVIGSEAGLKAAVDTSDGGSTLSDSGEYGNAIDGVSDDRLGLVYINTPQLLKDNQGAAATVPDSLKKFFEEPSVATIDADRDGIVFEGRIPGSLTGALPFLGQGSELLTELPADSWLAMAQPNFDKTLDFFIESVAGFAGGRDAVEQQFKAATGLDLQKDVLDWMGDFAVFVRGTSVSELGGALIVETKDETASGRFIERLRTLARSQVASAGAHIGPLSAPGGGEGFTITSQDVPQPIHLFQREGRVVVAYGDAAAHDAIEPGETLADSAAYQQATGSLGDYDISFYLVTAPILQLVDATGAASDADWQKAKPYVEPLSALVGGTSGDGDDLRSAVKLIVK